MDRNVRLNGEEITKSGTLVVGKLAVKTVGVEDGLALRLGHLTKITPGAGHQATTIGRKRRRTQSRTVAAISRSSSVWSAARPNGSSTE